ncbi:M61 family metallopeptidase [Sphingomonas sp. S2-65]|uniref:M61 family metallopeptidase n=1 Tax=Sphingomonas sp. S2-65 TaxID=2903960 RepID=UPI001F182460|nr:peptidase M61 [Sphingomonas sp. S2-65]UYY56961.1 peptidase M61 [Sphingomonas sp. S2-65]
MCAPSQPSTEPAAVPTPADTPFPGRIQLRVDARDVDRRIFRVHETIPVAAPGPMTLLFPEWLPGYHAPQAPIELFAGLKIEANGQDLRWKRHPVNVHAFAVDVPEGVAALDLHFQFLSPTDAAQGRVVVGPDLLMLQWNTVILYPAGYYARGIEVEASVTLLEGWQLAGALQVAGTEDGKTRFAPVPLDVLVDSPVLAGRHFRRVALDARDQVHLNMAADSAELLAATPEQIAPHRALIEEADLLFGTRPFDRYEILFALSDEIGSIGVEHHRSCEAATIPEYFTRWDERFSRRDTIAHEYIHSWNGKHRRGADSWTPSFDRPIRNSLMWVYEGQTQYWDRVLCARSGLWTRDQSLGTLALTAATQDVRAGSRWRPMSDTTRDPIITARGALPWASWQRSEDYYGEGSLVWLDVDTRLRELSKERHSLDDFARAFFGSDKEGDWSTNTYSFDDVVAALQDLAPFDWKGFFLGKLEGKQESAPLAGLERGGYQLVYRPEPSAYWANVEAVSGIVNLTFSLGLTAGDDGKLQDVLWEGPAFQAGLTNGATLLGVNGRDYSPEVLRRAVTDAGEGTELHLRTRTGKREREVVIECPGGHRYPHLEPRAEGSRRLDVILEPKRNRGA